LLKIEFPFLGFSGMTFQAELLQQWSNLLPVFFRQDIEGNIILSKGKRRANKQHKQKETGSFVEQRHRISRVSAD